MNLLSSLIWNEGSGLFGVIILMCLFLTSSGKSKSLQPSVLTMDVTQSNATAAVCWQHTEPVLPLDMEKELS